MAATDCYGVVVKLNGLAQKFKKQAWAEINMSNPALATLLKDENLKAMIDLFDAELYIEAKYAPSLPAERVRGKS